MSRLAHIPVPIPAGVDIKVDGQNLKAKGPKGSLEQNIHPYIAITVENKALKIDLLQGDAKARRGSAKKLYRAIAGTVRSKLQSLVHGVANGYERKLQLIGVGYRAQMQGKILNLVVGYSHPVTFMVPVGITIETPTQTEVVVKGADKHLVGHVAAKIRAVRPPEPYNGKGIKYFDEVIIRKETKK